MEAGSAGIAGRRSGAKDAGTEPENQLNRRRTGFFSKKRTPLRALVGLITRTKKSGKMIRAARTEDGNPRGCGAKVATQDWRRQ
jgi:hypothetical protein